MTGFAELLSHYRQRVDRALDHWLPDAAIAPQRLHEAMRYMTLGEGKRLRPILVYAAGRANGVAENALDGLACAVELIHSYSLVHDDLPAMDNDDLRRGRPTCHRAYDEATAVLVGDALQVLAFEILARDPALKVEPQTRVQMIAELAGASGTRGMAGGQAIDLAAMGKRLTLAELETMHRMKTGALISVSVRLGTLACPRALTPQRLDALTGYAECIGLAFQIRDDILDEQGEAEVIGKTPGADRALDKPTYTTMLGLAQAKQRARQLHGQALELLSDFGPEAGMLRDLSAYIVERRR